MVRTKCTKPPHEANWPEVNDLIIVRIILWLPRYVTNKAINLNNMSARS